MSEKQRGRWTQKVSLAMAVMDLPIPPSQGPENAGLGQLYRSQLKLKP
jgi:hypothetical protein